MTNLGQYRSKYKKEEEGASVKKMMDDGKRKMVIKTTRKRDEKRIGGIGNKLYCLIIFVVWDAVLQAW